MLLVGYFTEWKIICILIARTIFSHHFVNEEKLCLPCSIGYIFMSDIIRDYHMGFWLSPAVLTRDSIISPEL